MSTEQIEKKIDKLTESFNSFVLNTSVELAVIKTQAKNSAKIWGLIGGFVSTLGAVLVIIAKKYL